MGGSCEPFRVWSRLEPRPRQVELDRTLEARIHDPLWMLTRQWQFGEFRGEDAGSAVSVALARRICGLSQVRVGDPGVANDEPYNADRPLESRVERLPIPFPPAVRAAAGRQFSMMLTARLPDAARAVSYRTSLRTAFPLVPQPVNSPVTAARAAEHQLGDRVASALAGRAMDGITLAQSMPAVPTVADLPAPVSAALDPLDVAGFLEALKDFRAWFFATYAQPGPLEPPGWDGAKLEYSYSCSVPRDDGRALRLIGSGGPLGRVDWFCFDIDDEADTSGATEAWEVTTAIPSPVAYAGMPDSRWWKLEDQATSLSHLRADATDLTKLIVTEFALVYGNNWLCLPYAQPVGTLAEIAGIVVRDVFGERTLVRPATGSTGTDWSAWDFFSLSPRRLNTAREPLPSHLFLPPTLPFKLEGPAVEEVTFLRDEMANMVWAVETRIPDGLGGGRDGAEAARRLTAALGTRAPAVAPGLRYQLSTTVPENWLPFLPVHVPLNTHAIRLQRGWMPRLIPPGRVRPITSILSSGIQGDVQVSPYFVNEEEVPRAGLRIRTSMARARWHGGSTVVWNSRRVFAGRGEGASGLRFDLLSNETE
jgi:hypothetical protein